MKNQRGIAILEIILIIALLGVVGFGIFLATQKATPTSSTTPAKVSTTISDSDTKPIKSTQDVDNAIKENEAESTDSIDSDLSQIDQDLKDL